MPAISDDARFPSFAWFRRFRQLLTDSAADAAFQRFTLLFAFHISPHRLPAKMPSQQRRERQSTNETPLARIPDNRVYQHQRLSEQGQSASSNGDTSSTR